MSKTKHAVSENVAEVETPQLSTEELNTLKSLLATKAAKQARQAEKRANRTPEQKAAAAARHKKYATAKRERDRALIAKAKAAGVI